MGILNVAEKPSVAKSIAEFLSGGKYDNTPGKNKYCRNYRFSAQKGGQRHSMVVTSVLGHLLSLDFQAAKGNWEHSDPKELLVAPVAWKPEENSVEIQQNIRSLAQKSDTLILWTDCDREGEAIGNEIAETAQEANGRISVRRARYSSITREEILRSFLSPATLDMKSVDAVNCRQEIDLRIGSALTRLQTVSFKEIRQLQTSLVSYGPCQFPTLGFIVEQFKRARTFVAEAFWHISVVEKRGQLECKFTWDRGHLFDKFVAFVLYERCLEGEAMVVAKTSKPRTRYRPLPLRTVELQKKAASTLKLSSKQVMGEAEWLYTHGYISYPRTETDIFENKADLKRLVGLQRSNSSWGTYSSRLLEGGRFKQPRNGKNNDNAHPPIHPTKADDGLTGKKKDIYSFIARRFLACCSPDAEGLETCVALRIGDEAFSAKGLEVRERGYLEVYTYEKWTESELPPFEKGERFTPFSVLLEEGKTTGPRLLTEADLVSTMDKNGIGTDATIHEHIEKILVRGYATRQKDSTFLPTGLGIGLVEGYDQVGLDFSLTRPYLRARMESDLSEIVAGSKDRASVTLDILALFEGAYNTVGEKIAAVAQHIQNALVDEEQPSQRSRGRALRR